MTCCDHINGNINICLQAILRPFGSQDFTKSHLLRGFTILLNSGLCAACSASGIQKASKRYIQRGSTSFQSQFSIGDPKSITIQKKENGYPNSVAFHSQNQRCDAVGPLPWQRLLRAASAVPRVFWMKCARGGFDVSTHPQEFSNISRQVASLVTIAYICLHY